MNGRRTVMAAALGAVALVGCAQVLGIQDTHSDPADAGGRDATTPTTPGDAAREGGIDATIPSEAASADAGPDVAITPPKDAGPDANVLDPSRGCPRGDGGPTRFRTDTTPRPTPFAINQAYVYVTEGKSSSGNYVFRCGIEGCTGAVYTVATGATTAVAANDRHLFWINLNAFQTLEICDLGGTQILSQSFSQGKEVVAVGSEAYALSDVGIVHIHDAPGDLDASAGWVLQQTGTYRDLAASDTTVAFTSLDDAGNTSVFTCPVTGCPTPNAPVAQVGPSNNPFMTIAVDDSNVYWTDPVAQTIGSCNVAGCAGGPTLVATGVMASALAIDATGLYWAEIQPTVNVIQKSPFDGGHPVTVSTSPGVPYYMAANTACVYWTTGGNIGGNVPGALYAAPQP